MTTTTPEVSDQLRRLITQNQEMERRLRELQLAIAGIRADFETVVAARLQEISTGALEPVVDFD